MCFEEQKPFACGDEATAALRSLIAGKDVSCERIDTDRFGRMVARCRMGTIDIGAWMVRQGRALAFRRYSLEYVNEENAARIARRGMWRGEFEAPWDWRRH